MEGRAREENACAMLSLAKSLFVIAYAASHTAAFANANLPQRIHDGLIMELAFHEKQMPPGMRDDGKMGLAPEAVLGLLPDVARVVVEHVRNVDLPETISAQFAKSGNEQPADILTVAMVHLGEGQYRVADASRDAMASWFIARQEDALLGRTVLLHVDGLPEAGENIDVSFEIEGECAKCATTTVERLKP